MGVKKITKTDLLRLIMGDTKITKGKRGLLRLIKFFPNTETISLKPTEMINLRSELEIPEGSSLDDCLDGSFDDCIDGVGFELEITDRGPIRLKKLSDSLNTPTPDIDNYVRNPYGDK